MALYLQMDGVDDLFKTPSGIPVKKVVANIQLDNIQPKATPTLLDSRNAGYLASWDPVKKEVGFVTPGSTVLINGVSTITLPMDTKFELTDTYNSQITTDANGLRVFADRAGASASFTKGRIYNVKMYDSSSNLVAYYDMTTGTVQDQSGNGYHATLTGGTWLDDGVGGTPVSPIHLNTGSITKILHNGVVVSKVMYNQSTITLV